MILEEERIQGTREVLRQKREWCKQLVRVGERYERLLANKDFRDMLSDLETTLKIHRKEVDALMMDLDQANSPFKLMRVAMVLKVHRERMKQIEEAIHRPEQLVEAAKSAQDELNNIEKQEKEIPDVH